MPIVMILINAHHKKVRNTERPSLMLFYTYEQLKEYPLDLPRFTSFGPGPIYIQLSLPFRHLYLRQDTLVLRLRMRKWSRVYARAHSS